MSLTADNPVHCRRIGMDDWRLWRRLRLEALEESPDAFSAKLADWQGVGDTEARWRNRLSSVPFNGVACLNHEAAGMVSATVPDVDGTIELLSMWVAPFARGRGVGDILIKAVLEWGNAQQAGRIALDVSKTNEYAAALYRRHGFMDRPALEHCEHRMVCDL